MSVLYDPLASTPSSNYLLASSLSFLAFSCINYFYLAMLTSFIFCVLLDILKPVSNCYSNVSLSSSRSWSFALSSAYILNSCASYSLKLSFFFLIIWNQLMTKTYSSSLLCLISSSILISLMAKSFSAYSASSYIDIKLFLNSSTFLITPSSL